MTFVLNTSSRSAATKLQDNKDYIYNNTAITGYFHGKNYGSVHFCECVVTVVSSQLNAYHLQHCGLVPIHLKILLMGTC